MKLLRIDSSPRTTGSHSKDLADMVEDKFKAENLNLETIHYDLSAKELPHISQAYIEATFVPKPERTATMNNTLLLADGYIKDIQNADTVLISVPMYNFTIPSTLKAYIDYISRSEETFRFLENGIEGLLLGKKLVIVAAYGADFSQMRVMDFVEPYLKTVFGFLGFTDITYIAIENTSQESTDVLHDKKIALVNNI